MSWVKHQLRSTPVRLGLLGGVVVAGILYLAVLGSQVARELTVLRAASQENVQWTLSQVEVDLLMLNLTLSEVSHTENSDRALSQVRRRFDVFYSRANLLNTGAPYRVLHRDQNTDMAISEITSVLSDTVPMIDSSDSDLNAAIPELSQRMRDLRGPVRRIALEGSTLFTLDSKEQRALLSALLLRTSLLSGAIFFLLAGVLLVLVRQYGFSERESAAKDQSNKRLSATVAASLDAIIVTDAHGRIIDFNGAATRIFGHPREDAIGRDMASLILPQRMQSGAGSEMAPLIREAGAATTELVEMVALRADGSEFPIEASIASAEGTSGPITVSFLRDISARIAAQQELTQARDRALDADKAKSNFLAVMSHEMRTPLNGLLGTMDLLDTTDLDAKQRTYLGVARTSGNLLLQHVNNVLDISKMGAARMDLAHEAYAPRTIINDIVEIANPVAAARRNQIDVDIRVDDDLRLLGDPFRVGQTLLNLVSNAAKFTENGQISVILTRSRTLDGSDMAEFRVIDTGIGIAPENIDRIFDDFVTIDSSYSRGAEGTGLGLGISRRMAEIMGGRITVDSQVGAGSRFSFFVPWIECDGDQAAATPRTDEGRPSVLARGERVLLVEDNEINRFVAREMLEQLGFEVHEAHDGLQGATVAGSRKFDLILMDISMPVMDGIGAAKHIRASGGPSAEAPIVGLTAHAFIEEQQKFREAGMQKVLTKPITKIKLIDALSSGEVLTVAPCHRGDIEDLIDFEILADLSEILGDKLGTALNGLKSQVEGALSDLNATEERAQIASISHAVAGSTAMFGAERLASALRAIEQTSNSAPLEKVKTQIDGLDPLWQSTQRELLDALEM